MLVENITYRVCNPNSISKGVYVYLLQNDTSNNIGKMMYVSGLDYTLDTIRIMPLGS